MVTLHCSELLGCYHGHWSDQSWSWVTFSKPNPTQNFWTQPNPTHKSLHPTQPIIDTWYGILGYTENFIQQLAATRQTSSQSMTVIIQLQYSLADSRVFHDVKNITQSSLHPTQPNPTHQKLKNSDPTNPTQPNPTQPNPTHGWTQPMTNSVIARPIIHNCRTLCIVLPRCVREKTATLCVWC